MEALLEAEAARGGDVVAVGRALGVARRHLPLQSRTPARMAHLDELLYDAATAAAEVVERHQANARYTWEIKFHELARTNEALVAALDFAAVQAALVGTLGQYRIGACFVCVYEDEAVPAQWARLIVAADTHKAVELPPGGLRFPCRDLLPGGLLPVERSTLLVCPLLRGEARVPGYVVFTRGAPEGFIYDFLLTEIGAAYQRIHLVEKLLQETRRRETAERERLEREMQIANHIQTGILPQAPEVSGLDIAAAMHPATEVGGDYYDVSPTAGGCWLGIGDVAGHGLPTGLVMVMLQSVVGGLVRSRPEACPRELVAVVNALLFDNIHRRMGQDEYVTLTLLRYDGDGRLTFAGAHEALLVWRAGDGSVETIETSGMWVAALPDVAALTDDREVTLAPGDVLLLYTDGITEAMHDGGEQFGLERLTESLGRHGAKPVLEVRDAILAEVSAFMSKQSDDLTLVVVRRSEHKSARQ